MGGHGGLNILPQKRWNVYNFENREKVRKDEEEQAARDRAVEEEQRRRDSEVRLHALRARTRQQQRLPPQEEEQGRARLPAGEVAVDAEASRPDDSRAISVPDTVQQADELKTGHINLFEGLVSEDFSALASGAGVRASDALKPGRAQELREKEEQVAEDERYRLGYGVVGKGAQQPWYARTGDLTAGAGGEGGVEKGGVGRGDRRIGKGRFVEAEEVDRAAEGVEKGGTQRGTQPHQGTAEGDDRADDRRISSRGHTRTDKSKRKKKHKRSPSPDSSSSASLSSSSSSSDDDNNRGHRHSRSRRQRRVKERSSSSDLSSSSSDSDAPMSKRHESRHRRKGRGRLKDGSSHASKGRSRERKQGKERRSVGVDGGGRKKAGRGGRVTDGGEAVERGKETGVRCGGEGTNGGAEGGKKSIEELRAERVAREGRERDRAQMLLLQHHQTIGGRTRGVLGLGAPGIGPGSGVAGEDGGGLFGGVVMQESAAGQQRKLARYNSGFGYGR